MVQIASLCVKEELSTGQSMEVWTPIESIDQGTVYLGDMDPGPWRDCVDL